VRPGAAVYGVDPGGGLAEPFGVRPALSWRSAVTMVKTLPAGERLSYGGRYELERDATIATVPVGYDDGFPRQLEGRAEVLIGGRQYPVAGTITMDQILVDCGDASVAPGDEVVLIGAQGDERIRVEELAERAGTIARQITTGIGRRVPREYVSEEGRPR
jgi:alanine racemase